MRLQGEMSDAIRRTRVRPSAVSERRGRMRRRDPKLEALRPFFSAVETQPRTRPISKRVSRWRNVAEISFRSFFILGCEEC